MQGLEVFDAAGVAKFSTQDRLARILGSFVVNSGSGSFFVPGVNTGEPFLIVTIRPQTNTPFVAAPAYAAIDKSSQIVSWSISNGQLPSTIVVGVY